MQTKFKKKKDLINHIIQDDLNMNEPDEDGRLVLDFWLAGPIVWTVEQNNNEQPEIICNTIRYSKRKGAQFWWKTPEKNNPPFYTCNPKLYLHAEVTCPEWRKENEKKYNLALSSKRIAKRLNTGDTVQIEGISQDVEIVSTQPLEGVYDGNSFIRNFKHKILRQTN